jgi:hypothetical protein
VPNALAENPTPGELRALEIRGQALTQLCSDATLSSEAYLAVCGAGGAQNQPTRSELQALDIRGQGLNHLCDDGNLASAAAYRAVCGESVRVVTPAVREVGSPTGFAWRDFVIGAIAALGGVLLAAGIGGGLRYGRRDRVRPRTAS